MFFLELVIGYKKSCVTYRLLKLLRSTPHCMVHCQQYMHWPHIHKCSMGVKMAPVGIYLLSWAQSSWMSQLQLYWQCTSWWHHFVGWWEVESRKGQKKLNSHLLQSGLQVGHLGLKRKYLIIVSSSQKATKENIIVWIQFYNLYTQFIPIGEVCSVRTGVNGPVPTLVLAATMQ